MPEALALTGTQAWAVLPLRVGGSCSARWRWAGRCPRTFPAEEVELLRAFAAQCAQALDRLQIRGPSGGRRSSCSGSPRRSSAACSPPPPIGEHLRVAVGYQPARSSRRSAGTGTTRSGRAEARPAWSIGDVAGHDKDAAAAMAQVRNVLRGIAQVGRRRPRPRLAGFDAALAELELNVSRPWCSPSRPELRSSPGR